MQRSSAEDESWSRDDMQNCWSWMAPTRGSGRPAISSDVPRLFDNMMLTRKQQLRETMQECRFSFIFLIVYFLWFLSPLTWLDVADPCGSHPEFAAWFNQVQPMTRSFFRGCSTINQSGQMFISAKLRSPDMNRNEVLFPWRNWTLEISWGAKT
jgi:hypothetical protein